MDLEIKLKMLDDRIKELEKEKVEMDAKKIYLETEKKKLEVLCKEKGFTPEQLLDEINRFENEINKITKKVGELLDAVSFSDEV